MAKNKKTKFITKDILKSSIIGSFQKLDPRYMIKNPVMFVVEIGCFITLLLTFVPTLFGGSEQYRIYNGIVTVILFVTVLFANFAESVAEGRGKAQAASLKKTKQDTKARKLLSDGTEQIINASELKKGDLVLVKAGELIPNDGEVIEGIASVDESAITGESAPVTREAGGDFSSVTGGTTVVSDWLKIKIVAEPGKSFLDKMISMVEGASRQKTPNEIALNTLLIVLTLIFLIVVVTLYPFASYLGVKIHMYYYALLLNDGTVLRVSKSIDNLASTAVSLMPVMGILAVLTILFAFALARWQTNRLIKPINELDLERPLDSDIYEELSPLLEAMDRQNREKEAVANMRKEFSANVSHELKTPLTSISGYAEIMKNGLVRPEDISGFSERIYKEARRLITLIEDIIKLSKLDEESVELEKEDVDLYELTREIVSRLSPQAAQKNIRIELSGESVHYHGIRQILDEMVYNVCENAVKYNYENGKVSVWAGNTLNGPKISVSDTGIGIPKEHQERIFERFYRVDKSHSKERGGTGLGLSIVKHGALLHGAKVSVESEEGRGTKISMQFPRICQK